MHRRLVVTVVLLASLAARSWGQSAGEHIVMGMPSTAGTTDKDDYLVKKGNFVLSYNSTKGTPNWVSWHLSKKYLGDAPRQPFHPDDTLPRTLKKVDPKDYKNSGFDRGHMCPHSDRDKDDDMSLETFVMTNIVPQSPENNQRAWNQLEIYCRDLVEKKGKELYIVSGPLGQGGVGRNGPKDTIARGRIVVPKSTWKVILVVNAGTTDPAQVKGNARLIAVIVPNNKDVGLQWDGFRRSVQEVEEKTGYKFFSKVTNPAFLDLKEEVDETPVGPPVPVLHH